MCRRSVAAESFERIYRQNADNVGLLTCTDSLTPHSGALGCVAFGVGTTDMANAFVTGAVRITVPESLRVQLDGPVPAGVTAKDIAYGGSCTAGKREDFEHYHQVLLWAAVRGLRQLRTGRLGARRAGHGQRHCRRTGVVRRTEVALRRLNVSARPVSNPSAHLTGMAPNR